MDNWELLAVLKECADCICTEKCPYINENKELVRCMTFLVRDTANAFEKLLTDKTPIMYYPQVPGITPTVIGEQK